MPREFDGLVAAVTGGGSGIGLATVRLLAARGARAAALDLYPSAAAESVEGAEGPLPLVADVTDETSVEAAIAAVAERWGGLDVLVNNAGIGAQGTVEDNPLEEWRRVLDVNLLGMVRTTRAALPHLRRSGRAAIVNTCSIAATAGLPQRALYSATKGAVLSLTLAMAADHLPEGIRVSCVNPGTADTPWVRRLLARDAGPPGRAGRPPGPPTDRPAGLGRGSGGRYRPSGQPAGRLDHRYRPGRRRRHAGPAPPTPGIGGIRGTQRSTPVKGEG